MDTERGKRKRGEGRTFWRGKTLWIAYCVDGRERRESARTDDQHKADKLLARRLFELEEGKVPVSVKERRKSINLLLDALKKHYEAHTRSAGGLESVIKPLREAFGDRRASSITTEDLDDFILSRRKAGDSEATIGARLRRLVQAYRLQNAVPPPEFPPLPRGRVRDVLISPGDQRRLVAALEDECYRDMAKFYFATGWRGSETLKLEWRHVREGTIRLVEENSKTAEPRDFPIHGAVADILTRRAATRSLVTPYVFHRRNRQVNYRGWLTAWDAAARRAGLGAVKPHDARRAFATESVNSGIDPQVVMQLTGHKTPAMLNRYRIVTAETLKRAIERREQYVAERTDDSKVVVLADHRASSV
jgi:integrase